VALEVRVSKAAGSSHAAWQDLDRQGMRAAIEVLYALVLHTILICKTWEVWGWCNGIVVYTEQL